MKLAVFASLLLILPFQTQAGSCVGKKVDVWVLNGGQDHHGMDTYVKLTIGSDTVITKVVPGDSGKTAHQKLQFTKPVSTDMMKIEVMQSDGDIAADDEVLRVCFEPMISEGTRWRHTTCKTPHDGAVKVYYKCF